MAKVELLGTMERTVFYLIVTETKRGELFIKSGVFDILHFNLLPTATKLNLKLTENFMKIAMNILILLLGVWLYEII